MNEMWNRRYVIPTLNTKKEKFPKNRTKCDRFENKFNFARNMTFVNLKRILNIYQINCKPRGK